MVVVALGWFYRVLGCYWYAGVFELAAKFEIDFWFEKIWVLGCFLEDLLESLNLGSDFSLFSLEIFVNFGLNSADSLFNLWPTDLVLFFFRIKRYSSK